VRLLAALALSIAFGAAAHGADAPPEPASYRLDNYRAPTPTTLAGAPALTTAEAADLWRRKAAAFIDVLPQPPRPASLPADTLWRPAPRDSIPGAIWLPNVGFGEIAPETDAYFRRGLASATGNDPSRSIVLFCMRDCWMSWNAAKRARSYGYQAVRWYADGTDGWKESGLALARAEPAP
jgi:PQQ-dependent catabolism-associated CXXCW motif protein